MLTFAHDHFIGISDRDNAKALFKRSVNNVILELFSYCNRRCHYCPVSLVDRISSNKILDATLFERIIADLREIDYDARVCLNLYNEPLTERALLLRSIATLKAALPRSFIYFSSNGDYLTPEYLAELKAAGLGELHITLHQPIDRRYSDLYSLGRFSEFSARLGLAAKFETFIAGTAIRATMNYEGMPLYVFSANYDDIGYRRAGLMEKIALVKKRTSPCDRVFGDFTVSYDGTIFPCCHLFADAEQHRQYAIGNLADFESIFHAYADEQFAGWRRGLLTYSPKMSPCDECGECDEPGTRQRIRERDEIHARLIGPPPRRPRQSVFGAVWALRGKLPHGFSVRRMFR